MDMDVSRGVTRELGRRAPLLRIPVRDGISTDASRDLEYRGGEPRSQKPPRRRRLRIPVHRSETP